MKNNRYVVCVREVSIGMLFGNLFAYSKLLNAGAREGWGVSVRRVDGCFAFKGGQASVFVLRLSRAFGLAISRCLGGASLHLCRRCSRLLDVAENFFDEMGFGDISDQPSCRLLYTGLIDGEGRCL